MAATLRDVAERAGVSKITVSRVMNGKTGVSASTEERVRSAVEELRYVPNQLASSLRSQQTSTIALLLPDITNPYWTTVARGVEDEAERQGLGVLLCNTDENPDKEAKYLEIAVRRRVDGIILGPTRESAPLLHRLIHRQTKFVLIDRTVEGVPVDVVRAASYAGAFALTEHLLTTGVGRVAFVGGPTSTSTGLDRLNGYKAALIAAGNKLDDALIKIGQYSQKAGYVLSYELLQSASPPEAIFTGNNQITLGALLALARLGKGVPSEIAVVAFDDIPALNRPSPFLTAAIQPAYKIGRLSVERLLARVGGETTDHQDLILPTRIVVRHSCGCALPPSVAADVDLDDEAVLADR